MLTLDAPLVYQPDASRFHLLICLEGEGRMGSEPFRLGEAWLVAAASAAFPIEPASATRFLRTWTP